jgi:Flp pilus assembly CpaF family ATPase
VRRAPTPRVSCRSRPDSSLRLRPDRIPIGEVRGAEALDLLKAWGTGHKTTLVNALLAEVAKTFDRVVLIEDTRELQCQAPNLVSLRTKDGVVSLSDLVRQQRSPTF